MGLLTAIHGGHLSDMAAPRSGAVNPSAPQRGAASTVGGSQTNVHNAVYFDKNKMVDDLAKPDAHEKFIVDVMASGISTNYHEPLFASP